MTEVVGVRFREVGKIYTFATNGETFRRGDHVIADTAKGPEYGTVILGNYEICENSMELVADKELVVEQHGYDSSYRTKDGWSFWADEVSAAELHYDRE